MAKEAYWTNKSVRLLAKDTDPIKTISEKARNEVFAFLENGGQGPPFNPFEIAAFLGIDIQPSEEVRDARTLYQNGKFLIEFNPNRPSSRVNYSVAHDIIHTFFPDCKEEIRNRSLHNEITGDDWQLEMLCNIGAAELLMPIGSFPDLAEEGLSIEKLLKLREAFNVSMESLLLRFVKITKRQCWVFAASRLNPESKRYKVDYAIASNRALAKLTSGSLLPPNTLVADCTAIGFTALGHETWTSTVGLMRIECVGIPAYPGHPYPRVVGFAKPAKRLDAELPKFESVKGDATKPRGHGRKIIAFIVNDATPRWGAGFALSIRKKWPTVQDRFIDWVERNPKEFALGKTVVTPLDEDTNTAQMICQRGYGESKSPRLRYAALESCLRQLADAALASNSSVHMPMIGSGQARGNWSIVREMIQRLLSREGVPVCVYEFPSVKPPKNQQMSLLFSE